MFPHGVGFSFYVRVIEQRTIFLLSFPRSTAYYVATYHGRSIVIFFRAATSAAQHLCKSSFKRLKLGWLRGQRSNDFPSSRNPYFSTQRNARSLNGFSWKPRPRLSLIAGKQTSKNQFFANLPLASARNIKHP